MDRDFESEKNLIWHHSKLWYDKDHELLGNQNGTDLHEILHNEKRTPKKLEELWDHSERQEHAYPNPFHTINSTRKPSVTFSSDLDMENKLQAGKSTQESPKCKKISKAHKNIALCKDDVYWLNEKNSMKLNEPLLVYMFIEGKYLHVGPLEYSIQKDMTVKALKTKVCRDFQIRAPIQKLILANTLVSNEDKKIDEFAVIPGSSIFLYLELSESESQSIFRNLCEKIKLMNSKRDIKTNESSSPSEVGIKKSLNKINKSVSSTFPKNIFNTGSYEDCLERNERRKKPFFTNNSYENIDKLSPGPSIRPDSVSSDKSCRRRTLPEFKIFKTKFDYRMNETQEPEKSLNLIDALKASKKRKVIANEGKSHDPSEENVMKVPECLVDSCSSDNNSAGYVTVSSSSSSLYTDKEGATECSEKSTHKIVAQNTTVYSLDNQKNSYVGESALVTSERTFTEDESLLCTNFNTNLCLHATESEVTPNFSEQETEYRNEKERQSYGILLELEELNLISNTEPFECSVCLCTIEAGEGILLRDCLHTFCKECLSSTVIHSAESFVKCPYRDECYSCTSNLQQREIKALVPQKVFEQYLQRSLNAAESTAKGSFHCKTADCAGWCLYEDNANIFLCPVCSHYNCLTCQAIHEGLNCLQYQDKLREKAEINEDAKKTLEFLQKMVEEGKAMKCPSCCITLMKKWGCDWLKCSVCSTEVCWVTKGPRWGPNGTGDTSGGCKCGVGGKKCHPSCVYCH